MKRPKLNKKEKFLFVTPFLVVILSTLSQLKPSQDRFIKAMEHLSGTNAIDCGVKNIVPGRIWVAAAQSGKPFRAFTAEDLEKKYLFGIVRTPQGELYDICWRRSSWFSKGQVTMIARVRHLKQYASGVISQDGGNVLTPNERNKLLQN